MDQRGWAAVGPLPPFEPKEGEQHRWTLQIYLVLQMDLGLLLHRQAAGLYMQLHHTNCSE